MQLLDIAKYYNCTALYYSDIFLVLVSIPISQVIRSSKKFSYKSDFAVDLPITEAINDRYNYSAYCRTLARHISESTVKNSFAIAVTGKWGDGKTSFINMIIEHLDKVSVRVILFNPWRLTKSDNLVDLFFNTLLHHIDKSDQDFRTTIIRYKNTISSISSPSFFDGFADVFDPKVELEELHQVIARKISLSGKRYLIVLDDLDRCERSEVADVFALIRNMASFPNCFFIAAYDPNFLIVNSHEGEISSNFAEKIFQLNVSLPHRPKSAPIERLIELFEADLKLRVYKDDLNRILYPIKTGYELNFKYWLRNIRDVERFFNVILVDIEGLFGEVDFDDFFLLELLKFRFPEVYYFVSNNKDNLFDRVKENSLLILRLKAESTELDKLLEENFKEHLEHIKVLIKRVFDSGVSRDDSISVKNPLFFDSYFSFRIDNSIISNTAFVNARKSLDLDSFISSSLNRKTYYSICDRLKYISDFISIDDYNSVLSNVLTTASKNDIVGIPFQNLYSEDRFAFQMSQGLDEKIYEQKEDLLTYLRALFLDVPPPYSYASAVIRHINTNMSYSICDEEFWLDIIISYFKEYFDNNADFEPEHWKLLHCLKVGVKQKTSKNSWRIDQQFSESGRAVILHSLYESHYLSFIQQVIRPTHPEGTSFQISPIVLEIFETEEKLLEFKSEIEKKFSDNPIHIEFWEFFFLLKNYPFPSLNYDFQHIQIA